MKNWQQPSNPLAPIQLPYTPSKRTTAISRQFFGVKSNRNCFHCSLSKRLDAPDRDGRFAIWQICHWMMECRGANPIWCCIRRVVTAPLGIWNAPLALIAIYPTDLLVPYGCYVMPDDACNGLRWVSSPRCERPMYIMYYSDQVWIRILNRQRILRLMFF